MDAIALLHLIFIWHSALSSWWFPLELIRSDIGRFVRSPEICKCSIRLYWMYWMFALDVFYAAPQQQALHTTHPFPFAVRRTMPSALSVSMFHWEGLSMCTEETCITGLWQRFMWVSECINSIDSKYLCFNLNDISFHHTNWYRKQNNQFCRHLN